MTIYAALGLLLALAALAFVLYPVLRAAPSGAARPSADQDLAEQRRALYQQIIEIEFDQRVGKLEPADARELCDGLLRRAAELLAGQTADASTVVDEAAAAEAIEREIRAVRRALAAAREPELGSVQT